MTRYLKIILAVTAFVFFSGRLFAVNPPPLNDSVWDAHDLGMLPLPPACPSGGWGQPLVINNTTNWASYNTFDFSPAHCFPNGSPDVWYKFVSSSSQVTIDALGFNGLDTFFIKLYHSQGSCFSLVPLACETSIASAITFDYQTPAIGDVYYLQIGGNDYDKTGDFTITIKSKKVCNECVDESSIAMSPSPWFGRYSTSQSVTMCYTVDRWDYLGSADLHGIVPRFGPDWDISTLTPLVQPNSYSANNAWHWFTGINTPDGPAAGFFFDYNGNGNPSDNRGDSAGVLSSWQACWQISTLPNCNTFDLSVDVRAYSDDETGVSILPFACNPSTALHCGLSGWCCPAPYIVTVGPVQCNGTATVTITGNGNAGDMYNFTIYDTSFTPFSYAANLTSYSLALPPGEYTAEVYNINSTCITYSTIQVLPTMQMEIIQTAIGCGSGTAELYVKPTGGLSPYTYNFVNLSTSQQNDSIAFQVPNGWQVVTVTDAMGCIITDSVWVISDSAADASFDYPELNVCGSADSVAVGTAPPSSGGSYLLVSPAASSGITVNQTTGTVDLTASTLSPPYWVYVKYSVNGICPASYVDSFQVIAPPLPPTVIGSNTQHYCIGDPAPVLSVTLPLGTFGFWTDVDAGLFYIGSSYQTLLNSSSSDTTVYIYLVSANWINLPACGSSITGFAIDAEYPPYFNVTPSVTICPGDSATLIASPCSTCVYTWTPPPTISPANSNVVVTAPSSTTTYTVTATSPSGCSFTLNSVVNVDASGSCGLHIYSGFTPNGDGHNDAWVIDGIQEYPGAVVSIYNRWGKLIWMHSGYDNQPSGVVFMGRDMYGAELPDGTYYYTISGDNLNTQGWIELTH